MGGVFEIALGFFFRIFPNHKIEDSLSTILDRMYASISDNSTSISNVFNRRNTWFFMIFITQALGEGNGCMDFANLCLIYY